LTDANDVLTFTQTSPSTAAAAEGQTSDIYQKSTLNATGSIEYRYGQNLVNVNAGAANSPITGFLPGTINVLTTYPVTGVWQNDILPHATATWSNAGVPYTVVYSNAEVATFQLNADSSFSFMETQPSTVTQTQTMVGAGVNFNGIVTTTVGTPVPGPSASVIPVAKQTTSPTPGPISTFLATDWYPGGGAPIQPLFNVTDSESFVTLPSACNLPAVQAWAIAVQTNNLRAVTFQSQVSTNTRYFVPGGVGYVCTTFTATDTNYNNQTGGIASQTVTNYAYGVLQNGSATLTGATRAAAGAHSR